MRRANESMSAKRPMLALLRRKAQREKKLSQEIEERSKLLAHSNECGSTLSKQMSMLKLSESNLIAKENQLVLGNQDVANKLSLPAQRKAKLEEQIEECNKLLADSNACDATLTEQIETLKVSESNLLAKESQLVLDDQDMRNEISMHAHRESELQEKLEKSLMQAEVANANEIEGMLC